LKVAAGLACAALALGAGAARAQAGDHATLSSDGSVPGASAAMGGSAGASFEGTLRAGEAPDAAAEFPAMKLSGAELEAFNRRFKPKLPPYARRGPDVQPETVVGADRRFRLYPRESGFPYRAIGLLTYTQDGADYMCTAWLISKDTVATAGHCVYQFGWSTNVRFYPAYNAGVAPFGSCSGRRLFAVARWVQGAFDSSSQDFDYGAVKLNCDIGKTTGWLGYYATADSLAGLPVLLMGYAGDKSPPKSLWGAAGSIAVSERRVIRYQLDTGGGQSGAPLIEADRGASRAKCFGTCVVGIHTYGDLSGGNNSGTRINQAVADNLTTWKNAP
jgi:glutamyl endopeptidase